MSTLPERSSANIRPAVVAGRFYPAEPGELRSLIEGFIANVPQRTRPTPKAIIAPHAGYLYSGPIAASAFAQLLTGRDTIKQVVLLGPSHHVSVIGLAASSASGYATPLGVVPVDREAVERVCALPDITVSDKAHALEHALEVELPFLQTVLREFSLVPLAVGEAETETVSRALEVLWDGPQTVFVISSDLSHYCDAHTAQQLDRDTAKAIEALGFEDIGEDQACGRIPIRGLLHAARRHGLRARTLDLRNSGDTSGPRGRVVGYGAFAFEEQGSLQAPASAPVLQ